MCACTPFPLNTGHVVIESGGSVGSGDAGTEASPQPPMPQPPLRCYCVWLAMQLLGQDLWDAHGARRAFCGAGAAAEVAAAGKDALRALRHLHARGVVHRDIKPENLAFVRAVPRRAATAGAPPPLVSEQRQQAGATAVAAAAGGIRAAVGLVSGAVRSALGGRGAAGAPSKPAPAAPAAARRAPLAFAPAASRGAAAAAAPLPQQPLPRVALIDMGLAAFLDAAGSPVGAGAPSDQPLPPPAAADAPAAFYGTLDHASARVLRGGGSGGGGGSGRGGGGGGSAMPADDLLSLGAALLELQLGALPWNGLLCSGGSGGNGGEGADADAVDGGGDCSCPACALAAAVGSGSGVFRRSALVARADAYEACWDAALRQVGCGGGAAA